jgi:hypothetical protein
MLKPQCHERRRVSGQSAGFGLSSDLSFYHCRRFSSRRHRSPCFRSTLHRGHCRDKRHYRHCCRRLYAVDRMLLTQSLTGVRWLAKLARYQPGTPVARVDKQIVEGQIERLEALLLKLGTLHEAKYAKHEKAILDGLAASDATKFEAAQHDLGEMLGFQAGNQETDAAPDPWWIAGNCCVVFEDHSNAKSTSSLGAVKARQVAGHPKWIKDNKELTKIPDGAHILPVLVTLSSKLRVRGHAGRSRPGARPQLVADSAARSARRYLRSDRLDHASCHDPGARSVVFGLHAGGWRDCDPSGYPSFARPLWPTSRVRLSRSRDRSRRQMCGVGRESREALTDTAPDGSSGADLTRERQNGPKRRSLPATRRRSLQQPFGETDILPARYTIYSTLCRATSHHPYSNVINFRSVPTDSGEFRLACHYPPVAARTASLIFATAKCPIMSKSRCGRFGSSFETTTASTIAGPSTAKASLIAVCNSPGSLAANP